MKPQPGFGVIERYASTTPSTAHPPVVKMFVYAGEFDTIK